MSTVIASCPHCESRLEFQRSGRYGRLVASCPDCGDDYGLAPSGVGRLGATPGFHGPSMLEPRR
jgi:uncharacterized protein (DUF983 family)